MHRSKDKVFLEGVSNTKFFQLKASELEFQLQNKNGLGFDKFQGFERIFHVLVVPYFETCALLCFFLFVCEIGRLMFTL